MEQIIITIITGIVSVITCVISNRTSKKVDKNHKQMNNAILSMMRNDIVDIYYKNVGAKKLQQYEREALDKLYDGYSENGGNSFVGDIYEAMRKWEVTK